MLKALRRGGALLAALSFCLIMAACRSAAARWQEQYDLGQQHLSALDYEQAIIAFTSAIEIDPSRGEAYEGRGDAHAALAQAIMAGTAAPGEGAGAAPDPAEAAREHYTQARADYESTLDLMELTWPLVGKLSDVYDQLGDADALTGLLQNAQGTLGEGTELDELLARYGLTRGEDGTVEMDWKQMYLDISQELDGVNGSPWEYYLPRAQIRQILTPYAEKLDFMLDNCEDMAYQIGRLLVQVYYAMGDMDKVLSTRQRVYAATASEEYCPDGYTYEHSGSIDEYNGYGQRVKYTTTDNPYYDIDPVTYAQGPKKYYTEVLTYTYNEYGQRVEMRCESTAPASVNDSYITTFTYDEEGRLLREENIHRTYTRIEDYTYEGDTMRDTDYVLHDGVRAPDTVEYVYKINRFGTKAEETARYQNGVQIG